MIFRNHDQRQQRAPLIHPMLVSFSHHVEWSSRLTNHQGDLNFEIVRKETQVEFELRKQPKTENE